MKFALITGGSKGIGQAIAIEMAKRNYNLLLVARSNDELKLLAETISAEYKVQVNWLSIDLSERESPQKLFDWCQANRYEINVLVNNAGYGLSGLFDHYSVEQHMNMLQVNVLSLVYLTRVFLPLLKQEPEAYILNVGSTAAYQSVPYLSAYAASKSFVLSFSRGLHYELKKTHVSVTCVSPGATDTAFSNRAQVGEKALKAAAKFNMRPEEVAVIAVKGMFAKKAEVITGGINKASAFFAWLLPKQLAEKAAASIYE